MDKFAVMHVWKKNCGFVYEMGNWLIDWTGEQEKQRRKRTWGVILHESAKPSRQWTEAAAKANPGIDQKNGG